ncbi:MAG: methyltransferase [Acidobacteriia bacterium]|nr:methyltransferase [Terriglobia bacterium]
MGVGGNQPSLRRPPPSEAAQLYAYFREMGYSREGLRGILHANEMPSYTRRNLPRLLDATSELSPLHTLIRLFTVGAGVNADDLRSVLPGWVIASCLHCGLVSAGRDEIKATVTLFPFEELILATDPALEISCFSLPDVVLGINASTWVLHEAGIRRHSRATLDLGTGCGPHALMAASHSDQVVATDLNPRATHFAAFNARFNGFENVECLTGDTFQPVAGRTFDLILANPPFFISPQVLHLYCDNQMELDGYCRRIVKQAPAHLNEGGFAQMLCEWAQVEGERPEDRLGEWLEGSGCDAWLLSLQEHDISKYAQDRIRDSTPPSPEADAANYSAWMDYYRAHKLEAIHTGLIIMRRRAGQNWIRIEPLRSRIDGSFGDVLQQGFVCMDSLSAHATDEGLLAASPKLVPGARLVQRMSHAGAAWKLDSVHMAVPNPAPFSQQLEPLVSEFICQLDGSRTLQQRIEELAAKVNADAGQVRRECIAAVRQLMERGILIA